MKSALITGITGQDGSYLAELLLHKGYKVFGLVRRAAMPLQGQRLSRIKNILDKITLLQGDIRDAGSLYRILSLHHFDEIYHLAAQSDVAESFRDPHGTFATNIDGTLNMLEAIRYVQPSCRFYFAGSSEQFGKVKETPQNEDTPFYPRSPYGVSKVAGFDLVRNYRESFGLFACNGILFNHESPRRGENFVTRKITRGVAKIHCGLETKLYLGNLDAKRDWGHAEDYVRGMWLMLQQDRPDDYVLATGETNRVSDFAERAFNYVDKLWLNYVYDDKGLNRPAEVDLLLGDSSKARKKLGWEPEIEFFSIIYEMVTNDIAEIKKASKGIAG